MFTYLIQHGYVILDITNDRVIAEMWYSPILEVSDKESFGIGLKVEYGKSTRNRKLLDKPAKYSD